MNSPFYDPDALLTAAGVPVETPNKEEIARRIFADSLVRTRAMEMAIDAFVTQALARLTKPEKDVLRKRTGVPVPLRHNPATWMLKETMSAGHPYVFAFCSVCNQDLQFAGPVDTAHGSKIGISKGDVSRSLDLVGFSHCGHTEKMTDEFRARAEQVFQRIVTVDHE